MLCCQQSSQYNIWYQIARSLAVELGSKQLALQPSNGPVQLIVQLIGALFDATDGLTDAGVVAVAQGRGDDRLQRRAGAAEAH